MRRAIAPDIAHQMNLLLRNVVMSDGGTAAKARVDGFTVAGKTGTAQMVNPENGTYYQNRHVSSFVGFLPADDPRLLILVALYDVGHEHFGGSDRGAGVQRNRAGCRPRFEYHRAESAVRYCEHDPNARFRQGLEREDAARNVSRS